MFASAPAWVRKGAVLDLDFVNNRYWGGYVSLGNAVSQPDRMKSMLSTGSNATANTLFTPGADGVLVANKTAASMRIVPNVGLWIEGDITNTCLWSRDLTQTPWVKTNCTAAKTQVGADNAANSASLLTATAAAATCTQALTVTVGTSVYSAYLKRSVGTGIIYISMDGGTTLLDVTAQLNSSTFTLVQVPVVSITNPTPYLQIATSGDAIAVDFCQQEKVKNTGFATKATTRVLTVGATATRLGGGGTEEAFFYTPTSNYNEGIRWINDITSKRPTSFAWEGTGNAVSGSLATGTDVGGYFVTNGCDGNAVATATGQVGGLGNTNKITFSQGGGLRRACVNGNAIASAAAGFSNVQPSHGGIGDRGAGDISLNGYVRRVTYWVRELTDGEMLEYTR